MTKDMNKYITEDNKQINTIRRMLNFTKKMQKRMKVSLTCQANQHFSLTRLVELIV